jgi:RhoGEF domain
MPVQRIPRHILLLTDLAKHTPPEHPDYASLTRAVERTKEVAVVINDAKGRAESNTKVLNLF